MEKNVARLAFHEQLWAWFEANKKQVLAGAIVVAVAGVVVSYYLWYQGEKEVSASEELSIATAPLTLSGGGRGETAEAYLKVAAAHPGTDAAGRAVLLAAGTLFAQGKYADAQALFERFIRENPESQFRVQAQLGLAACLEVQGKADEAMRAYKDLVDRHPNDNIVPQAKFALARIYESQNKLAEAFAQYRDLERVDPGGSFGAEAADRAEDLKTKHPELAPAAPPAPASISLPGLMPPGATNAPKEP
jgi:tetratricopeptide (TPR) repeat protein